MRLGDPSVLRYLPELRISERGIREIETRSIREIEEFAAHLQLHSLAYRNSLLTDKSTLCIPSLRRFEK